MLRLGSGILKGLVIGGAIGYGYQLSGLANAWSWLCYGSVGLFVGLFVGRPLWSHLRDGSSTVWTPVLKGIVGALVTIGLYALATRVWGGFELTVAGEVENPTKIPFVLGGFIGALYGAFVEIDDAAEPSKQ